MSMADDDSLDAEGMPELEGQPPGVDVDLEQEGLIPPREYPIAAGGDPAYPTTAAEQRVPESIRARAARELPERGARELGIGGGIQGAEYERRRREEIEGQEPFSELDAPDPRVPEDYQLLLGEDASEDPPVRLLRAETENELGTGDTGELLGEVAENEDEAASAEEAAIHLEGEP